VWFPSDPAQVPWSRFLDEIAEAGYEWLELGPYGYLPTDPSQLADEVGRRGVKVAGGTVGGWLHQAEAWPKVLESAERVARLAASQGARFLVYLPDGEGDVDWSCLTRQATELAKRLKQEHDVSFVFHPHADSYVETQPEVERFLEGTDPAYVALCLDTGHIAYGRGDSCDLIRKYPDRIGYVHLKQVDPRIRDVVDAEGLTFGQAVQRGICPEPPNGEPSFEALLQALRPLGPDLFTIVEQDLYPCPPEVPLPIARRTRAYLRSCGFDE
jgi:inosose dehydratase